MAPFLQTTTEFIGRHHEWAGVVLGATTFLESLVLIGAFVPATALMLVAGGLIAGGVLDPFHVVFACVVGAVLGDAVSFTLGRRFGARALQHPALAPHRRRVALTRLLCRRYGVISIFAARFLGPVRALGPLVLGAVRMRRRTFQAANVASAVVWVPAMLAPGYLGAKGLAKLELLTEADHVTILILALVAAAITLVAGVAAWRIHARRTAARALPPKPATPA